MVSPKKCLTIGGWDPCGAYGAAADMKTFAAHGVHGMAVLTVATAQNSVGWYGAEFMPVEFVEKQLDAVLGDYGVDAVKTGFVGRADLIEMIHAKLVQYEVSKIVIDPVVLNGKGESMFGDDVTRAYETLLFPLATVVTPNLMELNFLLSGKSEPWSPTEDGLDPLKAYYDQHIHAGYVAIKGLPLSDDEADGNGAKEIGDGWFDGEQLELEPVTRIKTENVAGTGDTFSAALTAHLAVGEAPTDGMHASARFVYNAIKAAASWKLAKSGGPISNFSG